MLHEDALDEASDYIIFDNCDPEDLDMDYKIWIGGKDEYHGSERSQGMDRMKWGSLASGYLTTIGGV